MCSSAISTEDEELDLPSLYCIPKLHKCSYKLCYIAGPQNFPGGTGGGAQIQILNFDDILQQTVITTSPLIK